MRHKDANLQLTRRLPKAAQCQPDVTVSVYRKQSTYFNARQGSADAPQGCKPALGQKVWHWLLKSSSVS